MNKLLQTIKKNDEEFDKNFDQYNPIHDNGKTIPTWCGADYGALKSHITQSRIKELEALVEMIESLSEDDAEPQYQYGQRDTKDVIIQKLENTIKELKGRRTK